MSGETFFRRFIFLVFSFVLRMWILTLRLSFIRILLGWDGLGVTSYLLVIFYQREKSSNAGIITALTNHLGNVGVISTLLAVVRMRGLVLFIL
jgi:NADH-ubiquinone oxidoreductase chain 5